MYVYVYRHSVLESILHVIKKKKKQQHYHFFFIKETPEESRPIWSMHNITVLTKSTVFLLFVSISVSSTKLSHLPLQSSGSSGKQRSPKRLPQLREKGSKPVTHKSAGELSDALCKCKPKTQHRIWAAMKTVNFIPARLSTEKQWKEITMTCETFSLYWNILKLSILM